MFVESMSVLLQSASSKHQMTEIMRTRLKANTVVTIIYNAVPNDYLVTPVCIPTISILC